jgi:hypothetical protein
MDPIDELLEDLDMSSNAKKVPIVEEAPTMDELRARLREKKKNTSRQKQIQKRNKKLTNQSYPLTEVYYCENKGCLTIMTLKETKRCGMCRVFVYCSAKCQHEDWKSGHKNICGKSVDEEMVKKRNDYIEAHSICDKMIAKFANGKYLTVLQTKNVNHPACMFASMQEKSNVLNWKEFMKTAVFTTTGLDSLGDFSEKVISLQEYYPDKKVFLMSVVLDRLRENQKTECAVRLFVAPDYGETMDVPIGANGKITKTVTKYQRK